MPSMPATLMPPIPRVQLLPFKRFLWGRASKLNVWPNKFHTARFQSHIPQWVMTCFGESGSMRPSRRSEGGPHGGDAGGTAGPFGDCAGVCQEIGLAAYLDALASPS